MAFYSAKHERERRERDTPERIMQIAKAKGEFTVSLRYRDDWLRARCEKLRKAGLLKGGKRHRDQYVYQPAADQSSPAPVDSHNHGPDNTSDRTDITGGSFEGATK